MELAAGEDFRSLVTIEPISPTDEKCLRPIAGDRRIWRFNGTHEATTPEGFADWMNAALEGCDDGTQETVVIRDQTLGVPAGSTRISDIDRGAGSCEVGSTWLGVGWWGSALNTATKLAILTHAFRDDTRNRVYLHVDARNRRSARAMRKLGARLEGIRRFDRLCHDGHARSTLAFSVLRSEWSWIRQRLLERLGRFARMQGIDHQAALRRAIGARWVSIAPIDATITHDLRHAALRPNEDRSVVDYAEDRNSRCRHMGLVTLGQCVGVMSLFEEPHDSLKAGNTWRLRGMAVAEPLRGLGLGGMLIQAANDFAASRGADHIWCNAREPSIAFYNQWQFDPVGDFFKCATGHRHKLMVRAVQRASPETPAVADRSVFDDTHNQKQVRAGTTD